MGKYLDIGDLKLCAIAYPMDYLWLILKLITGGTNKILSIFYTNYTFDIVGFFRNF
jgi:hypothetical protein